MNILKTIISNYESEFKSELSEVIVNGFNAKQHLAFNIILTNPNLDNSALNKKIAFELYNCKPSYSAYVKFKQTFTELILKIAYLNKSGGSVLQKMAFELQEDFTAISKLIYMGLRSSVQSQFNKTLTKAFRYHNYEIARSLLLKMIEHYTLLNKNTEKQEAILKFKEVDAICNQEKEIIILYGELTNTEFISEKLKIKYKKILADLEDRLQFDSYLYHGYSYNIKLLICEENEYANVCNEAIEYFSNLYFDHSAYITIFRNRLLKFKISKGDAVNAKLILIALMKDHREHTYHWYLYAMTYVRVLLYFNDNKEAYKWYHKIRKSRNYQTLPKDHKNEWEILGMYTYILMDEVENINIRKVKYNLNYNKIERSKTNINFLVSELIYDIKVGKEGVERKIKNLQKLSKKRIRVSEFCKTLKNGKKYLPTKKGSFDTEIVSFENLVTLI